MSDCGHDLAASPSGKITNNKVNHRPPDISEGIAVEEKKRGAAMTLPQKLYGFGE